MLRKIFIFAIYFISIICYSQENQRKENVLKSLKIKIENFDETVYSEKKIPNSANYILCLPIINNQNIGLINYNLIIIICDPNYFTSQSPGFVTHVVHFSYPALLSEEPLIKEKTNDKNVGIKNIDIPIKHFLKKCVAALLIPSSFPAVMAFPNSIVAKIIINKGTNILTTKIK